MRYNIDKKIGIVSPLFEPKKVGCFFGFHTYLIIVSEFMRKKQLLK